MGCYELEEESLKFGCVASTRMTRQNGMVLEVSLIQALEPTVKWKIEGEHLEMIDLKDTLGARFESRYLK
jgi:heat shock protein HslJ